MESTRYPSDELKQLAARVVDHILGDEALSDALIEAIEKKKPPKPPECPPRTLCCSKNHVCSPGTGHFTCTAPFQCTNGHTEKFTLEA